jgi:ribonuclease HI
MSYTLYFDGASRNNQSVNKKAAYGWVIYQENIIILEGAGLCGNQTNNYAEYRGCIEGLKTALAHGADAITIKGDSLLIIKQLSGEYKVKSSNLYDLYIEAKGLLSKINYKLCHIPREQNGYADNLCNKILDQ